MKTWGLWTIGIILFYLFFGMEALFIYFGITAIITMSYIVKEQINFEIELNKEFNKNLEK